MRLPPPERTDAEHDHVTLADLRIDEHRAARKLFLSFESA